MAAWWEVQKLLITAICFALSWENLGRDEGLFGLALLRYEIRDVVLELYRSGLGMMSFYQYARHTTACATRARKNHRQRVEH